MATILPPSSLQLHSPFPRAKSHAPPPKFSTRATTDSDAETTTSSNADEDADFEARLERVRYRSGTGKKAEIRKSRRSKSSSPSSSSSSSSSSIYLPAVPLKEAKSVFGGTKVEFGFSPYSEKVNGLVAIIGLAALVSVELATGKSVFSFHAPAIVFVQVYFVAAVTTLFVKYEKESVSVWPPNSKND